MLRGPSFRGPSPASLARQPAQHLRSLAALFLVRRSAGVLTCYASGSCPGACTSRPEYCASGAAAQSGFTWLVTAALSAVTSVAQPNGAGELCFASQAACEGSSAQLSNCSSSGTRCVLNVPSCRTGIAGNMGNVTWMCPADQAANSVANGGGALCYSSFSDCLNGPNACDDNQPCAIDTATCATGQAAGATSKWCVKSRWCPYRVPNTSLPRRFCPSSAPLYSMPNGAGAYCYSSNASCSAGPNTCPGCTLRTDVCSTGLAGGQSVSWYCEEDSPTGSIPNGASRTELRLRRFVVLTAPLPRRRELLLPHHG